MIIAEKQLGQFCLVWFKYLDYDIAPEGLAPERDDYIRVILHECFVR
jgi:hypothetical protein